MNSKKFTEDKDLCSVTQLPIPLVKLVRGWKKQENFIILINFSLSRKSEQRAAPRVLHPIAKRKSLSTLEICQLSFAIQVSHEFITCHIMKEAENAEKGNEQPKSRDCESNSPLLWLLFVQKLIFFPSRDFTVCFSRFCVRFVREVFFYI